MLQLTSKLQIKAFSQLLLDLGKIIAGSVVIGFFIPSLGIRWGAFITGIFISYMCFYFGLESMNFLKRYG